jgi:hypothetical protein
MQYQEAAKNIAGGRKIFTRTTPAAAATALVPGFLAKLDRANYPWIQRGGFGMTMPAATAVAFSAAF